MLFFLPAIFWMGLISYLSSRQDVPNMQELFKHADKLAHFIVYLILGIWLTLGTFVFFEIKVLFKKLIVLTIGISFALTDEFHQSFVPNRVPDIYDFFADVVGIFGSLIFFNVIVKTITQIFNKINFKL